MHPGSASTHVIGNGGGSGGSGGSGGKKKDEGGLDDSIVGRRVRVTRESDGETVTNPSFRRPWPLRAPYLNVPRIVS